jgi:hypothetical protein
VVPPALTPSLIPVPTGNCSIGDSGASAIASALAVNTHLQDISLDSMHHAALFLHYRVPMVIAPMSPKQHVALAKVGNVH